MAEVKPTEPTNSTPQPAAPVTPTPPTPAPVAAPPVHVNDTTLPVGNPLQWVQQQTQQAEQAGDQLVSKVEVPWSSAMVVGGLILGLIALYYFAPNIRAYLESRGILNAQGAAPTAGEAGEEEGFEGQGEE